MDYEMHTDYSTPRYLPSGSFLERRHVEVKVHGEVIREVLTHREEQRAKKKPWGTSVGGNGAYKRRWTGRSPKEENFWNGRVYLKAPCWWRKLPVGPLQCCRIATPAGMPGKRKGKSLLLATA